MTITLKLSLLEHHLLVDRQPLIPCRPCSAHRRLRLCVEGDPHFLARRLSFIFFLFRIGLVLVCDTCETTKRATSHATESKKRSSPWRRLVQLRSLTAFSINQLAEDLGKS
jgi:hypothetical protein